MEGVLTVVFGSIIIAVIIKILPTGVSKAIYGFEKSYRIEEKKASIVIYQENGVDIGVLK